MSMPGSAKRLTYQNRFYAADVSALFMASEVASDVARILPEQVFYSVLSNENDF